MNVAAFFDVTGDGEIDHALWLNLGPERWFPGWFDDSGGRFGPEHTGVEATVAGDELVARFPLQRLPADRLRWSLASEWGRYEVIGTSAAARDQVPDEGPAAFP